MNERRKRNVKAKAAIRKAKVNRDRARQKLLMQREQLAERRESNRKQSERRKSDTSSDDNENPTVTSTLPRLRSNVENATRNGHSSVPEKPKYSDVEPRRRLYGLRFYEERTGSTDEGEQTEQQEEASDETRDTRRPVEEEQSDE